MTLITKPDFTYVWASGGAIAAPNDTKKQLGWVAEAPPFQYDNWLQNRQDQMLAHINQRGIPAWDGLTNYEAGGLSYVQGSDGIVYKSVAASGPSGVVSNPTTDGTDTYWTVAFLIQTDGDSRYTQRANNLSDVTNVTTARTNLGVYSKVETDTRNLNSVRIDIASASNINLSTAAPNTRHINITGTTSINGFTAVAGVTYFVRFGDVLTLTNSASLVTQTGASIKTASGDTCIIRATAANVVEIIGYSTVNRKIRGVAIATTSGTSFDFTEIPSWANRVTVMLNGVSTGGSSPVQLQLGAGAVEATGYSGASTLILGTSANTVAFTTGVGINYNSSADTRTGFYTLNRISGNSWVADGLFHNMGSAGTCTVSGGKTLSGPLDRIRLTTVNGTDTFDAGSFNIEYEG